MQAYWIDIAIIAIIALSIITGLIRGFVKELMALSIWALAIWAAYSYANQLDPWLQTYISEPTARKLTAYVLVVLGVLFAGSVVNALLSFILKQSGLSGTDRLLGMGFGFIRGVFLVALIMAVVKLTSLPYEMYAQNSKLYARFDPIVSWLSNLMPTVINQFKLVEATINDKHSSLNFEQEKNIKFNEE